MIYQVEVSNGNAVGVVKVSTISPQIGKDEWYKICVEASTPQEAVELAKEPSIENTYNVTFYADSLNVSRAHQATSKGDGDDVYYVTATSLSNAVDIAIEKRKADLFDVLTVWHVYDEYDHRRSVFIACSCEQLEQKIHDAGMSKSFTIEDTYFVSELPSFSVG